MATAEASVKEVYKSGFPKEIQRSKHNLRLNERLKAARNRKKLSSASVVRNLAKRGVNIGHSTLQGYEADENSSNHRYPSLPALMNLADYYGCSIDYIFGVTDRFKPHSLSPKELDVRDVLEARSSTVTYNGVTLSKKQKEILLEKIDMILGELV